MSITEKFLRAPGPIEIGGRMLKRYHITTFEAEIEPGIQKAAYDILPGLVPRPDEETPPGGWLVLHRGASGAYLCAYSWVWGNVVEMRSAVAGEPYLGCPDTDPEHFGVFDRRWIGCIWELAPFGYERSSWVRHILEPDRPDLTGYIHDTLAEGRTGGAK
ncbi:MAG TPA: hypothetical protein VGI66_04460 [Streptosporangiaceae bacterium]|jgi:hypothetical protein